MRKDTIGASIILHASSEVFQTRDQIKAMVGRNLPSIGTTLDRQVKAGWLERQYPRHRVPQGYRLTHHGSRAKLELGG